MWRGWVLYALAWVLIAFAYSRGLASKPGITNTKALWWSVRQFAPLAVGGALVWLLSARVWVQRARRAELAAAAAADALRTRAELAALRGQLNPHFFFNTLHSVTQLIREQPTAAADALERLGNLFRYVMSASEERGDEARIGDEWAFTTNYLALEAIRLGARLRVVDRVDPATFNCVIPSMTLQPLVENAIKHAASIRRHGATIEIDVRREADRVVIEVADDGPGETLDDARATAGIGLRLVRQRLVGAYPGAATLDVDTAPGRGFRVRVSLPADDGLPLGAEA